MARNLQQLQKQYNSKASSMAQRGGPGGGPRGRMATGKPKDMGKTIARLLTYLKKYRLRLVVILLLMFTSTLASLAGGYLLAPIIDKLTETVAPSVEITMSSVERLADRVIRSLAGGSAGKPLAYIMTAAILLASIYMISVLASFIQSRLMVKMSEGIMEKIRNDLFTKLQYLPVRYFDSKPTGEIMSRFTNDVDNIDAMISNSLLSIISGAIMLTGTLIFMITTNGVLTLVIVLSIPFVAGAATLLGSLSKKYYSGQQAALGAVNGYLEETVTGQKVVKVFNHEDECTEEFCLLNDDMRQTQFKANFFGGITGPVMGNMSQITYGITVGVGGILMVLGRLTPGGLTVFAQYSRQFNMPISQISMQLNSIVMALAGAQRIFRRGVQ